MKISQFARSRGVEPQAVSRYISRHPEIEALCTRENGRITALTPEAEALLGEQYPVPKDPVSVVVGVPQEKYDSLQEKYSALLERLAQIQEERLSDQKRLAAGEAAQALLEDRNRQLQEEQARSAAAEERAAAAEAETARLRGRGLWARIRNL